MNRLIILAAMTIGVVTVLGQSESKAADTVVPSIPAPRLVMQTGHTRPIYAVAISGDGDQVLTGSHDHTARLWDTSTGRCLTDFSGHTHIVSSLAFSPDRRWVLTGSYDKTARLWEAATGKEVRKFVEHTFAVTSVSFSPDGRQVLTGTSGSGGYGDECILWDVATGRKLRVLSPSIISITSATFSRDGKHVQAIGSNKAVVWEADTGKELSRIEGTGMRGFVFDGQCVLFEDNDHILRVKHLQANKEDAPSTEGTPAGSGPCWSLQMDANC